MSWQACLIILGLVFAVALIAGWYERGRSPQPRHAITRGESPRHARGTFADPADVTDPDGEKFLHALRGEPVWTVTVTPAAAQDARPLILPHRQPGRQLPAPARSILPMTGPIDPVTLGRFRDALRAWNPGQPDPAPDDTRPQPIAELTWGKSAHDLADELARTYLQQVTR
jgi:hypothetical protein